MRKMYSLGGQDGIFIPSEKPHIDLNLKGSQWMTGLGTPQGDFVVLKPVVLVRFLRVATPDSMLHFPDDAERH